MRGLELNLNLVEAGAVFVRETVTEPVTGCGASPTSTPRWSG